MQFSLAAGSESAVDREEEEGVRSTDKVEYISGWVQREPHTPMPSMKAG